MSDLLHYMFATATNKNVRNNTRMINLTQFMILAILSAFSLVIIFHVSKGNGLSFLTLQR